MFWGVYPLDIQKNYPHQLEIHMILMDVHLRVVLDHERMTLFTKTSFVMTSEDILAPIAWSKLVGITFYWAIHYMSIWLMYVLDTW